MPLTLKQAADETGLSKQGLLKAIKNGKISASKSENGQWKIEPVELFRVYPQRKPVTDNRKPELAIVGGNNPPVTDNRKPELSAENEILKEKLLLKEREMKLIEKRASELETDRDHWRNQAERLALTYQPAEAPQKPQESDSGESLGTTVKNPAWPSSGLLWAIMGVSVLLVFILVLVAVLMMKP